MDVDVRGWIFAPHKGVMTRKQRLFIGIARQMVGIPAPTGKSPNSSMANSRASSPHGLRQRLEASASKYDEEAAAREAENIIRKGESEASIAQRGGYSESLSEADAASTNSNPSRPASPASRENDNKLSGSSRGRSTYEPYDDPRITPVQKRASWNQPAQMSQAELSIANANLMERIKPFLANPMASSSISAFFYNEKDSRQKTIETDVAGHFTIRAALDFVPTHIRVLASEKLSITEKVHVTEPHGVSVISDIDDTVKHSSIASGAREIFKNVFIRDLGDLTVEGVEHWYCRLAEMDVRFHYVSNSPWQLFPLITNYFAVAKLPEGSFHLKQYSGMFQGIFEPVAERKKSTLEKILRDFPERHFLLVGDSGEADLEVYTDVVLEHPGRILGVFIRDVTTPANRKGFFDSAMGPLSSDNSKQLSTSTLKARHAHEDTEEADIKKATAASLRDFEPSDASRSKDEAKPKLPKRPMRPATYVEEDLIDLHWEEQPFTAPTAPENSKSGQTIRPRRPDRPIKPASLASPTSITPPSLGANFERQPPPRPRKPSTSVSTGSHAASVSKPKPASASTPAGTAVSKSTSASSAPAKHPAKPPRPQLAAITGHSSFRSSRADTSSSITSSSSTPAPRKPLTSYPAAAASSIASLYASATGGAAPSSSSSAAATPAVGQAQTQTQTHGYAGPGAALPGGEAVNKKEELWRRRWARARELLDARAVPLRGWRVGADVEDEAVRIVERARRETGREGRGRRGAVGGG